MGDVFRKKTFWISFIILLVGIFAASLNFNRAYQSETDFVILPKNPIVADNSDKVIGNLEAVVRSFSFFEKMENDNLGIAGNLRISTDAQKIKYWNSKVILERVPESSVFRIIVRDQNQYQAQILGMETSKILILSFGNFYSIGKEADLRIINGPITQTGLAHSALTLFLASIIASLILSYVLIFLSSFILRNRPTDILRNQFSQLKPTFAWTTKQMPAITEDQGKSSSEETTEETLQKLIYEQPYSIGKSAVAPSNLPIADDFLEAETKKSEEPIIPEATPEEVKERLNKLLSGKL